MKEGQKNMSKFLINVPFTVQAHSVDDAVQQLINAGIIHSFADYYTVTEISE